MSQPQDAGQSTISPKEIGHWGVRTTPEHYNSMVEWHLAFFWARKAWSSPKATMIAWDNEHHREVIVQDSKFQLVANRRELAGIYHIAFTLPSLAALAKSYDEKKARNILPHWHVNHGMTTSMYYFDPDGNEFELQVNNFDTSQAARDFMESEEYANNPIGVDIVIDDWLKAVKGGVDESTLKKRPIIGKRVSRFENSIYFKPGHQHVFTAVKAN